MEDDNNFLSQV